MIAIRITGLGRYFGPRVGLGEVSTATIRRHLLGILGIKLKLTQADGVQLGVIAGHVLKDISLEIKKGSIVCLAGPSGSGKSVLLKILAGQIPPTEGKVELRGTVSGLLSAGDNLDEILTALENIESKRRLMQVSAEDAERYARDVIAFAGLEGFESIMVNKYSTGMVMRLSLALALQGDPDILLLDDILNVGDIEFQQRCVERLLEMKENGCTMILALSDDILVRQLATRVITLGGGGIISDEAPSQALPGQYDFGAADVSWHVSPHHPENDAAKLRAVTIAHADGINGSELELEMDYDVKLAPQRCRPMIDMRSGRERVLRSLYPSYIEVPGPRSLRFAVRLPARLLGEGTYVIATNFVSLYEQGTYSLKHDNAVMLEVKRSISGPEGTVSLALVTPDFSWDVEKLQEGT